MAPTDHDELYQAYLAGTRAAAVDQPHDSFEQWLQATIATTPATICISNDDGMSTTITEAADGARTTSFGGTYYVVDRPTLDRWKAARQAFLYATRQLLIAAGSPEGAGYPLSIEVD